MSHAPTGRETNRLPAISPGMRIHFIGISGIGMSGLASICLERGCAVSGCDVKLNSVAHRLQERGAAISIGHHPGHLDPPTYRSAQGADPPPCGGFRTLGSGGRWGDDKTVQLVVYSSAVSEREPELFEARARRIRTISRGELLAALAADRPLIAVAGAHGKTTTSGMASQLLIQAGWDPTIVVGGIMLSLGTNARSGTGSYLIAETDESDGSFLHLAPNIAVITNIDREHLNHYQTFEHLVAAFEQFVGQLRPGGTLISCYDDAVVRRALRAPASLSYGLDPGADVTVRRIALSGDGSRFQALYKGRALGTFALQVPGQHNVLNALAVIGLGLTLEIPLITMREALASFQGTQRRFQVLRLPGDILFVEDYAHHPSEIRATLNADITRERHRLVVFQPHRFSRTQALEREFTGCFDRADGVIVTDIDPAFEMPIPGITGERLARLIKAHGHPCVRYIPKQELTSFVRHIAQPGDTIFFLGAGDIGELCHDLAARLHPTA